MMVNVDWQITGECNRKCAFCFGPSRQSAALDKKTIFFLVDLFHSIGVRQIGITGGEPLLRPDIEDVLSYIHEKEILIYLSTNCDFYARHKKIIKENVSVLGVPLDGSTDAIHSKHRGAGNFAAILNALDDILGHDIKVKIGTVVTKHNYNDLHGIERVIHAYDENLLFWKLYDLILYDRNRQCADDLYVSPDDYRSSLRSLGSRVPADKIIHHSLEKRDGSYFLVRPNGDVFVPRLRSRMSTEILLGNLLTTPMPVILDKWSHHVNSQGYMQDYRLYERSAQHA